MTANQSLKQTIQEDMKTAMRAKDKERLGTIRLIMAAFKQVEVDERVEIDDARALTILNKMVKQRHDAIDQFKAGGREDLATKEQAELVVIQTYLPEPLSDDEVSNMVAQVIEATGADSIKAMGVVMNAVKEKVAGRADMKKISALVKEKLS